MIELPAKYTTTVFVPFGQWVTVTHGLDVYGPVVQIFTSDGEPIIEVTIRHTGYSGTGHNSFDMTLSGWVFLEKEDGSGELTWEERGGDWVSVVVVG